MKVFIDIETIPGQNKHLQADIAAQFPEVPPFIEPTCPRNIKKAETMKAWQENTLPQLREEAYLKHQEAVNKREAAIEQAWHKTGLWGDQGEIICIAWAVEDDKPAVCYRTLQESELTLLAKFYSAIYERLNKRCPHWIGHNVLFDLRFLFQRSVILGIRPYVYLHLDVKPWSEMVQDTMMLWAGPRDKISLDRLCQALGIKSKGKDLDNGEYLDGSRVWEFVKRGDIKKVATYCKADVVRCREVYKRIHFLEKISFTREEN